MNDLARLPRRGAAVRVRRGIERKEGVNVLIVSANRNRQPVSVMPVGACIAAEAAEGAGHEVKVLDLMFEHDPVRALESAVRKTSPDVIGISIRNIDNNDMKNPVAFYKELPPLLHAIRVASEAPVVLGGAAVGVMPESFLRFTGASFAVLGDGEIVFPQLLRALSRNGDPYHIPGIAWIKENVFMKNPLAQAHLSDGCLTPDFQRWINVRPYRSRMSTAPVQSKRGCPYKCVYCTYSASEGQGYRLCASEGVIDRIENLVSQGMRDIEFVDNVFNSPYDHAMALCEGLAQAQLGARFQTIELNPLFINDALLTAMERAGFVGIGVTAESASDAVLNGLGKGFTAEHIHRAASCIRRHTLPCVWIFMFGGPGETEETAQETLRFAEQHVRPHDAAFFNVGIRIYPGTELERIARKEGSLTLSAEKMFEPVFYLSPEIDPDWLAKTLNAAMERRLNFINSDSLAFPFLSLIHRLGYRFGVKPPLWKHTSAIRRGLRLIGVDA